MQKQTYCNKICDKHYYCNKRSCSYWI